VVLYQLFTLAGYRKIDEIVEDELYVAATRTISDLNRTIQQSTVIIEPAPGASSNTLRLNGGSIVYTLDENNRLVKTEGGSSTFMTNNDVTINGLTFTRRGPSVESQTISVDFTVVGVHGVEGGTLSRDFTTSVTVR
jgi:hypothetical protein